MHCQEFEQIVTGLAEGQLMEVVTRTRAVAHTAECARCSRRWQDEQVLRAGLRALAASTAQAEAPVHLKQALRAAFDQQASNSAPAAVVPFPARAPQWPRWAVAAAAAVLLTAGVALTLWLRSTAPAQQPMVAGATASPTPTVTPGLPDVAPVPPPKSDKVIAPRRPASKPGNKTRRVVPQLEPAPTHANDTVAGQFIPLGYARGATQDGLVVRVEVSRASLIAMGLPLDAARADGIVKADLKVGVNGVPLAIRLLQ